MGSQTINQLIASADPEIQQYISMLQEQLQKSQQEYEAMKGELNYYHRALLQAEVAEDLHRAIDQDIYKVGGTTPT